MGLVTPGPGSRPRRTEGILRQEADGTVVLLSLESGRYFSLNPVGGRIWDLCDGSRTVVEIAQELGREFDAPLPTLEDDVRALVGELLGEKLVDQA